MDGVGGLADAGAVTPDFDDGAVLLDSDGARTPSDGEVASEGDNPGADEGLLQDAVLELPHVAGGGGGSAQYDQGVHVASRRKQRRGCMPNTAKPLAVRRAQTFSVSVVDVLLSVHGCRTSRFGLRRRRK